MNKTKKILLKIMLKIEEKKCNNYPIFREYVQNYNKTYYEQNRER